MIQFLRPGDELMVGARLVLTAPDWLITLLSGAHSLPKSFRITSVVAFATISFAYPALAQSPLNPAGWSDLYTQSRDVGFWINGQRICGVVYDPAKLEAMIAQVAVGLDVSVATLRREGQKRADEAAPFVTRDSCNFAKRQARTLDLLPGRAHRVPAPRPETANSLTN